eukprot:358486-Chlamydomonas_euryale.AAC.19
MALMGRDARRAWLFRPLNLAHSICQLFPDNDPQWRGASSDRFVLEAVKLMQERGYAIGNLDCTIIAQKPKLSPHKVC